MTTVNIWLPGIENVGHTSALYQPDSFSSRYISWWPEDSQKIHKPLAGRVLNYDDDILSENKEPDKVWTFSHLKEEKGIDWWDGFVADSNSRYHMASTNCSWAVIKSLKKAGSDESISWLKFEKKYNLRIPILGGDLVWQYLVDVFKTYRHTKNSRFAFKRPIVDIVDKYSPIWSPRDVNSYCDVLTRSINGESDPFVGLKVRL